jgi:hypothetical protein
VVLRRKLSRAVARWNGVPTVAQRRWCGGGKGGGGAGGPRATQELGLGFRWLGLLFVGGGTTLAGGPGERRSPAEPPLSQREKGREGRVGARLGLGNGASWAGAAQVGGKRREGPEGEEGELGRRGPCGRRRGKGGGPG